MRAEKIINRPNFGLLCFGVNSAIPPGIIRELDIIANIFCTVWMLRVRIRGRRCLTGVRGIVVRDADLAVTGSYVFTSCGINATGVTATLAAVSG